MGFLKKAVKKVGKTVKKAANKVGDVAGDIADKTKNIPGVNAFTSQLALLDDPGDFVDIWKKNILPQYAAGAAGGLGVLGLGALSGMTGLGGAAAAVPEGGFQIENTIYDAAGNILSETDSGGGGLLGGLGSILGGAGNALGSALGGAGGGLSSLLPALLAGGAGYALGNSGGGGGNQYGQQASVMDPATTDYFNRPTRLLDMDSFRDAAAKSGQGTTDYAAQNWDKFMRGGGYYNVGAPPQPQQSTPAPQQDGVMYAGGTPNFNEAAQSGGLMQTQMPTQPYPKPLIQMARGGLAGLATPSLNMPGRYARGGGSGRSDQIDAKVSPGEYIFDAESVSMLGDGSNRHGADLLDGMRRQIRQHKGRSLSRGEISPDAKSPLEYLHGAAR